MKLTKLCRGTEEDSEFFFSELVFNNSGEKVIAICIEANELRLLAISDMDLNTISKECGSDGGYNFVIETASGDNSKKNNSVIDIEACMEYLYDNAIESYECQRSDLGDEGISEAMESEMAVPLLLAYDYIRCADAEKIYEQLEASQDDSFIEDFDCTFW